MEDIKNKQVMRFPKKQKFDKMLDVGKIPPQAIDLEISILGAILLEVDAMSIVSEIIQPNQFYTPNHATIFEACMLLKNEHKPIDLLTVVQKLKELGKLEEVGGAYFLSTLTNQVASTSNIEFHCRIVQQKAIQRDIIKFSTEAISNAYNEDADIFNLLEDIEKGLSVIHNNIFVGKTQKISQLWSQIMDRNVLMLEQKGFTGVPSGFKCIDEVTGGWQKSDLILIAARPSMGKTSAMVCLSINASKQHNKAGLIFSLEMSALQLGIRYFCVDGDESTSALTRNGLPLERMMEIEKQGLVHKDIWVDDTSDITIQQIRSKARKFKREKNIEYIIVDYIQIIGSSRERGFAYNREQEVASFSRGLKSLAKELNIPIIALAQLSRSGGKKGERPTLIDLRESGSLEQDADIVIFLHRPEYYGDMEYAEPIPETGSTSTQGIAEWIIAKHRNGSVGTQKLKWISHSTKFTNLVDERNNDGGYSISNSSIKPNVDFTQPKSSNDIYQEDYPF